MPIGIHLLKKEFTSHTVKLKKDDRLYVFSDGYTDQFGGPIGKKYKTRPFYDLLLKIHNKDMEEQKTILEEEFNRWKGKLDQVDDILIFGIRINSLLHLPLVGSEW